MSLFCKQNSLQPDSNRDPLNEIANEQQITEH